MNSIQRGVDLLTTKEREKALKDIASYFLDERKEEIGVIAANGMLDFFMQDIAPSVYNRAIDDIKNTRKKELEEWDYTLSELRR